MFWNDWWIGDGPFIGRFLPQFSMVTDPDIHVAQAFEDNQWVIRFRRNLSTDELGQWRLLMLELQAITPSQVQDTLLGKQL
jgi:hypothetical protein